MADIFLSYNREDETVARIYAEAFERNGFSVWWDTTLRAGEAYDEVTEVALREARSVVVLWSPRSVVSRWVRAEATLAARNKTLVPVTIEACERPIMFELTQTADLRHWHGDAQDKAWLTFIDQLRNFLDPQRPLAIPANRMSASSLADPTDLARILQSPGAAGRTEASGPSESARARDGERKTVTVLSADIGDWLDRQDALDPEESLAFIEPALRLMSDVVQRHGGHVVRITGDGVLALFGAPQAEEDHPQQALFAALHLQEDLRRHGAGVSPTGDPLLMRVGVSTGEVVVRPTKSADGHETHVPSGAIASLADRLRECATGGAIVISAPTAKLAEGYFELRPLEEGMFEVAGLGTQHTRLQRSARRGYTRFVGRTRELETMVTAVARAQAGRGQIVATMAEPGVGKSRLLAEFRAAHSDDWTVLEACANSQGTTSAYLPVIELLQGYFGIEPSDKAPVRRDKIAVCIEALDPSLEAIVPDLNGLLGVPDYPDPSADLPARERQRRMHDAVKRLLLRESLDNPVMVIVEDLHWIDEATQEVLNLLAGSMGAARLLLLVNYRPEYQDPWAGKTYHTSLRLDGVSEDIADEMMSTLLGNGSDLKSLKRLIIERTEGNPLFIEETVLTLLEEGVLVREAGEGVRLGQPLAGLRIPPTVQAILAARIDRLPGQHKLLLQTLAVIGRSFSLALGAAVSGMGKADLGPMLAVLEREEFIYEQPTFGDPEYTFNHALTHEVAYASLLNERRRALHLRTAEALETMHAGNAGEHMVDRPYANTLLAHHLEEAGERSRAADYLRLEAARVFALGLVKQSVEFGLHAARLAGVDLPADAQQIRDAIGAELGRITAVLDGRQPSELTTLPPLDDALVEQRITLLLATAPFAYQGERLELFTLLVCTALRLTLEHGQGPLAPDVFAMYSIVLGAVSDDRAQAAAWSQLGLDAQRDARGAGFSRCAFIRGWFHNHWVAPLEVGIALTETGAEAGLSDGELLYGCFNLSAGLVLEAAAGHLLPDVMASARIKAEQNGRRVLNAYYHLILELQFAKAMAGMTTDILQLGDEEFDAVSDIDSIVDSGLSNQIGYYLVTRTKLCLHAGNWRQALDWGAKAAPMMPYCGGQTAEFELVQYRGLAQLALAAFDSPGDKSAMVEEGRDCLGRLRAWSQLNPGLFGHKADLLEGVLLAAEGRVADAERLLGLAQVAAEAGRFLHDAGLAAEYLARVRRATGELVGAGLAARSACEIYGRWGAAAKTELVSREFRLDG